MRLSLLTTITMCLGAAMSATAAERVPIHFNIPAGLEHYSGKQPVTFGVPFAEGRLKATDGYRVVDSDGTEIGAQFEVTATWTAEREHVRWLLIDLLAEIRNGSATPLFLEFGSDVAPPPTPSSTPPTPAAIGGFMLTDGNQKRYIATTDVAEFEVHGPIRFEEKRTGKYLAEDGSSIADFETRVRQYPGLPFVRVYHTMIWQTGPETELGGLIWEAPDTVTDGETRVGLAGETIRAEQGLRLRQTGWNVVEGAPATADGKQLDGWAELANAETQLFAALRWPWQQFPVSLGSHDGQLRIGLLDPAQPMNLKPDVLAVDYVIPEKEKWNLRLHDDPTGGLWNVAFNGQDALPHLSPRGVARTWEFVLWRGDPEVDPKVKNILTQEPVLAFADPAFSARAGLPSPMSPRDPERFPEIEAGLERAFDWVTRENAFDGDFGVWTYGDIQWSWVGARGFTTYRYWMNHGKGWSVAPWVLWLRSGDRRYWKHGETNNRHCMDIDTCHVPKWERAEDYKIRGGQYHYSALQLGYGPSVATFYIDSEYLPYYYYMTGYRRAWDVTQMRAEALIRDDFETRSAHFRDNRERRSRHLYIMLKDLAILYEATWRPELREQLKTYLDLTLDAQLDDGNFLGVKTNHYLDQPLLLAARVLPEKRPRIFEALRRWNAHQGDAVEIEPGRGGSGPWSMWTRHALAEQFGDPAQHAANVQLARTQTLATADDANEWRGYARFEAHVAGPILRDWVVAMAGEAEGEVTTGLAPLLHFNSRLPVDRVEGTASGREGRHVALVLKEAGKPLNIGLHLYLHNMGRRQEHHVSIVAPDGSEIDARQFYTQWLRQGDDQQGIELQIAADQPAGTYALVLSTVAPVCVKSSSGKVVHYMPEGRRAFTSAKWGGQAWFMPSADEVTIGNQSGGPRERVVVLGPSGEIIATSRITGTREVKTRGGARQLPVGEPARFSPSESGLHSFVSAAIDWHSLREVRGMKPWFSALREEWFDPDKHPAPDLKTVLSKRSK